MTKTEASKSAKPTYEELVAALQDAINYIDFAGREDDGGELTLMAERPYNKGTALLARVAAARKAAPLRAKLCKPVSVKKAGKLAATGSAQ